MDKEWQVLDLSKLTREEILKIMKEAMERQATDVCANGSHIHTAPDDLC